MRPLIVILVYLVVFGVSPSTYAQERSRVPRVGYLALGRLATPTVFAEKMREQGYVDGPGRTVIVAARR